MAVPDAVRIVGEPEQHEWEPFLKRPECGWPSCYIPLYVGLAEMIE